MKSKIIFTFLTIIFIVKGFSQEEEIDGAGKDLFDKVYTHYSENKLSVVILKDGRRIEGYKKDVDRKKGQIYYIKLKEEDTEKKFKFDAEEIKEMYLYPGGIQKTFKSIRAVTDVRSLQRSDLENDIIKQGYIYFKNQFVSLKNKKKKTEYLMQLINPTFCNIIEVFGDPNANETTSFGIAGVNMAGGLAKSYYVKKGDKIYWLNKKELDVRYESLFGDCKEFIKKYPVKDIKWKHLSEYILEYTKLMTKE